MMKSLPLQATATATVLQPRAGVEVKTEVCGCWLQTLHYRSSSPKLRRLHRLGRQVWCVEVRCQAETSGGFTKIDQREAEGAEIGRPVLRERVGKRSIRSYWLDKPAGVLRVEESELEDDGVHVSSECEETSASDFSPNLPQFFMDFVLPAQYPDSVSEEYLQHMLWQFPTHVTGWTCSTLVTSSLLTAVGIGGDGGSAAAIAAAVKWVTKDGLGALGRLFIGGRFGNLFDEDPKQWRMYADLIGSAGGIFELATPVAPAYFLLLASIGRLTKAIAQGLKDPSSRVILNHLAISDNLGELSAKQEVWEVVAELIGLAAGVAILGAPGVSDSYWKLVVTWTAIRSLHLWCRYQSLAILRLRTINYKRALILTEAYVKGLPIPGIMDCNKRENIMVLKMFVRPFVWVGCSMKEALGNQGPQLENLLSLYGKESYLLVLGPNGIHGQEARVVLKERATSRTLLRSMWQASWLLVREQGHARRESMPNQDEEVVGRLAASLQALEHNFDLFLDALGASGWDASKLALKVPNTAPLICD